MTYPELKAEWDLTVRKVHYRVLCGELLRYDPELGSHHQVRPRVEATLRNGLACRMCVM